ncbi:MAG: GWxTD domain-containing protein [Gemmatimonadota bacterium]|nr:MAG: GWxTD domain-containing protein [Gemmatimonadota bacterium]
MVVRSSLLAVTLFLVVPPPCQAQEETAPRVIARLHIDNGLALAAGGDTLAALAQFRQAVEVAPRLAEAHFQLGRMLARHASAVETDFRERVEAERALRRATSLDPDNPAYLAELGVLFIKQQRRNDGERVISRALKMAEERRLDLDPALLADMHFNLGWAQEVRYERERQRRLTPPHRGAIPADLPPSAWLSRYVEDYLEDAPPVEDSGQATRDLMIEHYWAAVRTDPTHFDASRRLLVHLLDDSQFTEYLSVARQLVEAHPDRPETELYLGLGLHVVGREDEAAAAFERALARLPEPERAPLLSIEPLLRREPAEDYLEMDDSSRTEFEQAFWRLSDRLYLTEANETRLEHMARVAYAELRFAEPATGYRGWETDRGVIFIRYGPPNVIIRQPAELSTRIVWIYRPGPVFMFDQTRGYFHARFAGDFQWVADEYRYRAPAFYGNIPSIATRLSIPVQVARFRGRSPDEAAVEIHAELPLEELGRDLDVERSEFETGIFLRNLDGLRIKDDVDVRILDYADTASTDNLKSWRVLVPGEGRLWVSVEARDAVTWRAAATRDTVSVRLFPEDSLSLSDILLAELLRPLALEPLRRADYDITPNPARVYVPYQAVHIYYEIYGLARDPEGYASFEVSLAVRVKKLQREGALPQFLGLLADAWGFSIVGDDRVELRYRREFDMKDRDRVTEHLRIELPEVPPGEYEIIVKIWDHLNERLATRTRSFAVVTEG